MLETIQEWIDWLINDFNDNTAEYIRNFLIAVVLGAIALTRNFFKWSLRKMSEVKLSYKQERDLKLKILQKSQRFRNKILVQVGYDMFLVLLLFLSSIYTHKYLRVLFVTYSVYILITGIVFNYVLWSKVQNEELKKELQQMKKEDIDQLKDKEV